MDWNPGTWKSIWKNEKSRWLLLLAAGLICLLLAVPSGLESGPEPAGEESRKDQRAAALCGAAAC